MKVVGVKLDTRELDKIAKGLGVNTDQAVKSIAFQVEGEAKKRAPRDPARPPKDPSQPVTGALRNTIHTEKKAEALYLVGDGVEYGVFQEYGTSRMMARPFLRPAIEVVRMEMWNRFKAYLFGGGKMF